MRWWDILDIEKDADLRTIKRAYAAKLKTIRQDENPAEFMALREAYENAQNYVKYNAEKIEDIIVEDNIDIEQETTGNMPPTNPTIMNDVEKLMKSPWGGNSVEPWQAIFDDERLDALDDFSDFEHNLLGYLLDIHGFSNAEDTQNNAKPKLSLPVADMIFTHFRWHKFRENSQNLDWLATQLNLLSKGKPQENWFSKAEVDKRRYENVLKDHTSANDYDWPDLIIPFIVGIAIIAFVAIAMVYLKSDPLIMY